MEPTNAKTQKKRTASPIPLSIVGAWRMMESSTATATDATEQRPVKIQKVKQPPSEIIVNLSEESNLTPPMEATNDHERQSLLPDTRPVRLADSTAIPPHQIQFIFSPRAPSSNRDPGTARLPRSDVLHQLHPMEYNESSYFRHGQPRSESISELAASLPTRSFPSNYASMLAPRPWGRALNHLPPLFGPQVASPPSTVMVPNSMSTLQLSRGLRTTDTLQSLLAGGGSRGADYVRLQDANMALAASQSMVLCNASNNNIGMSSFHFQRHRTASQILDDALREQRGPPPQLHNSVYNSLLMFGNGTSPSIVPQGTPALSATIPIRLPVVMAQPRDALLLNEHQAYLRLQIEVFEATEDDLYANTRGRNKRIHIGQVGLRCRHCAHLPARQREKGTVYFPATMAGLYQAAQNMSSNHIQCGLCNEMPNSIKTRFIELWPTKNKVSSVGRKYWEETARVLGLVDTDNGIKFQPDTVT